MKINRRRAILLATIVAVAAMLIAAACKSSSSDSGNANEEGLSAVVANYELLAGTDNRVIVGLFSNQNDYISYGSVTMRFYYLGGSQDVKDRKFFLEATGRFVAVPGEGPAPASVPDQPSVVAASGGRGVYQANAVKFDRAGIWQVEVTADTADGKRSGAAAFEVLDRAKIPNVGEKALPTDNLVIGSDVPNAAAIDSRFASEGVIPDAGLHSMTIADALRQNRPLLIVFATPVYCVSRFCGPITDMVADLQKSYGDRANFVHVEIWRDFQNKVMNKAAADWVLRDNSATEPWLFLVGKDGTIVGRWDNVVSRDELAKALDRAIAS